MILFKDVVQNQTGDVQAEASVSVYVTGTTTLAALFSDDGITPTSNPVTTDSLGRFQFYINSGRYDIAVAGGSFAPTTLSNIEITDILEFKPNDASLWTAPVLNLQNQAAGPTPALNTVNLYPKLSDKNLYYKDDTGREVGPLSVGGSTLLLKTNGTDNRRQDVLNLIQAGNVTLTSDGAGGVTISAAFNGGALSSTNKQSFGSFDSSYGTTSIVAASSLGTSGTTLNNSELAITAAIGLQNTVEVPGQAPDGTWTNISTGTYWKVLGAAGSQSVSQGFGATLNPSVMGVAFFKTNGSTPVFTARGNGSGGQTAVSNTFTPAAGNSVIFISAVTSNFFTSGFQPTIADTAGNIWSIVLNKFAGIGGPHSAQVVMGYAQNVKNQSTTITATTNTTALEGAFGTWKYFEISNIGNLSSGSYTFQNSDANKLVLFTGGAAVTATLPTPALAAGWLALASNGNQGIVSITSTTNINNVSGVNINLNPGQDTWIISDGSSYFTSAH